MTLIESIIERAKSNKQRIVLPESLEERTLTAADKALADEIAEIILIGNPDEIFALAEKLGLKNIDKATIIDPATSEKTAEYANLLYELRRADVALRLHAVVHRIFALARHVGHLLLDILCHNP